MLVQVAASVCAGSAVTTAVAAVQSYRLLLKHDRDLYGGDDFGEGVVGRLEALEERIDQHTEALRTEGML